eukprot:TRINITY_DN116313_c0_g1_i1.p1 TRINITY_DN116313_c0_g1~~TRINITY_DN116313_c0_g1_i1.p1  ORF type:complete len:355 (+),score=91.01 TRINITY_DN116313_c0_g1_i1:116-1066(+)
MAELKAVAQTREQLQLQTNLPQEDANSNFQKQEHVALSLSQAALDFQCVSMRYAPTLPFVLKEVSFQLQQGESLGVVGRTGAGKSSLVAVATRLVSTTEGKVLVNGVSVASMTVKALRKSLVIISQDCLLFAGTVRDNLDPFHVHSDSELEAACGKAHLTDHLTRLGGVNAEVEEAGANFSVGQRQLLCIARSFLKSSGLVLIDEATASLDPATDEAVQQVLQSVFIGGSAAAMLIAHRLETVAAADRVLCMDEGRIVEVGTPKELLTGGGIGHFASLVSSAGEAEAKRIRKKAKADEETKIPVSLTLGKDNRVSL